MVPDPLTRPKNDDSAELLTSYEDLLAFARLAGVIGVDEASALRLQSERDPDTTEAIFGEVLELRELLVRVGTAAAKRDALSERDRQLLDYWARRRRLDARLDWAFSAHRSGLDAFMGPIVLSAFDLLTTEKRRRIKICDAQTCVWLFYDTSKAGRRKWCNMKVCGNRAKARRHYAKKRADSGTASLPGPARNGE